MKKKNKSEQKRAAKIARVLCPGIDPNKVEVKVVIVETKKAKKKKERRDRR